MIKLSIIISFITTILCVVNLHNNNLNVQQFDLTNKYNVVTVYHTSDMDYITYNIIESKVIITINSVDKQKNTQK